MTTRLDAVRQRLAVYPTTAADWFAFADKHEEFRDDAVRGWQELQDARDLLETLDRIIEITKRWHDSYELAQDPDPDRPSHIILRNLYRIAEHLESNRRLETYDWTRERVDGTPLP